MQGISEEYLKMLRGEISAKEYAKIAKRRRRNAFKRPGSDYLKDSKRS
jgi:hypothetical protein